MLNVIRFYARSFDLDHINVFWEIEDNSAEDLIAFNFFLYKSESPGGPWGNPIVGPFQNKYFFQDTTTPTLHKDRRVFYKLKAVDKRNNEEKEWTTSQIPEPDLMAMEIVRLEDLLLRQFVGRKCFIFPRRTFGPKCTCRSKTSMRETVSNCINCYNTGFLGGYMTPIACYIQIDPHPRSLQLTQNIAHNVNMTTARMINFPPVKPADLLIENENRRWMVQSVRPTERLRSPVHQELEIKEILKSDVLYKLPVNLDILQTEDISETRNFTNPQTDTKDTNKAYVDKPRGMAYP